MDSITPSSMPQPMPRNGGKIALMIVLVAILVALVVGGGMYYWMTVRLAEKESDMTGMINAKQSEVSELQSRVATLEATVTQKTTPATETVDGDAVFTIDEATQSSGTAGMKAGDARTLFLSGDSTYCGLHDGCLYETWNNDQANSTVLFKGKGISFGVPYNSNWGSQNLKIPAYDYTSDSGILTFGPYDSYEASVNRMKYRLKFIEYNNGQFEYDRAKSELGSGELLDPIRETYNGLDIIFYGHTQFPFSSYTALIVGSEDCGYNYQLTMTVAKSSITTEEGVTQLKQLINNGDFTLLNCAK